MGVSISISISQNSQSVSGNSSNVTVDVIGSWDGGSYNHVGAWCGLTVDGTEYGYTVKINPSKTSSGSEVLCSITLDIAHNSDGTKKLECSAYLETGVSSGTVYASASKTLTQIARGSSFTVTANDSSKPLGSALKFAIDSASSSLTHTLTYKCGSVSGTILSKSSSTSTSWTPPLTLAQQNTKGTSVQITFTLTTYSGSTSVGTATAEVTCTIPASVAPTVSAKVTDTTGYYDEYGAYLQKQSTLSVELTAEGAQGSTITGYSTAFDDKTYTKAAFTVDSIKGSGTLTMAVTVRDSRGRSTKVNVTLEVLAYESPKVSSMAANRCDADGNLNSAGDYLKVVFNASVSPLNDQNSAEYALKYKKTGDSEYTEAALSEHSGSYAVTSGSYVFAAEITSSYDIILTITDDFGPATKSIVGSSRKKLWSAMAKGLGFAFGKVAELAGYLDMGFHIYMNGNKLHGLPEPEEDDAAATKSFVETAVEDLSAAVEADFNEFSANVEAEVALKLQMTLLWENESPGSTFAGNTVISLPLSDYTHVGIEFRSDTSVSYVMPMAIYKKGDTGRYRSHNSVFTQRAISSISASGVTFGAAVSWSDYGGSYTTNNAQLIPYRIYGIKGVT